MLSRSGGRLMRNVCTRACAVLLGLAACNAGADSTGSDQDRSYTIALGSQIIDIRVPAPALPVTSTTDDGYALVKFPGPVTTEQLQALSASAHIYTYLPNDTFLVRPISGGMG